LRPTFAIVIILLGALVLAPRPVTTAAASSSDSFVVRYASQITIQSINYANSTATIAVYLNLVVQGNWTSGFTVWAVRDRSYLAFIDLYPQPSGQYTSFLPANGTVTLDVPITGSSSFYPYDAYLLSLNFTFPVIFANVTMPVPDNAWFAFLQSGLSSQFQLHGNPSREWVSENGIPSESVSIEIDRKEWVGWAILGPIFMMFLMIGLFPLLPAEVGRLSDRTLFQLFVFVILLGYYWTIASALPPAASYLPLVQVLTYAGLTAVTIHLVASIFMSNGLSKMLMDSIAAIVSVQAFDFFLYTILFSNPIWLAQNLLDVVFLQLGMVSLLVLGLFFSLVRWWRKKGSSLILAKTVFPMIKGPPPTRVVIWLYSVSFAFNMGALLLTNYLVQILGPNIEVTPARRFLFQVTSGGGFFPSWILNIALSTLTIAVFYFILKRRNTTLWTMVGVLLAVMGFFDFMNDSSLFTTPGTAILLLVAPPVILTVAWSAVVLMERRSSRAFKFRPAQPDRRLEEISGQ